MPRASAPSATAAWADGQALTGLARDHFTAEFAIHRRHPMAEEWEDPDVALPRTDAQRQAGHQRLMAEETAESRAIGAAQWQARAELSPHQEAVALAGKPRGEGQPVIRRWKFLVVPADGEDEARGSLARSAANRAGRDSARWACTGPRSVHGDVIAHAATVG